MKFHRHQGKLAVDRGSTRDQEITETGKHDTPVPATLSFFKRDEDGARNETDRKLERQKQIEKTVTGETMVARAEAK